MRTVIIQLDRTLLKEKTIKTVEEMIHALTDTIDSVPGCVSGHLVNHKDMLQVNLVLVKHPFWHGTIKFFHVSPRDCYGPTPPDIRFFIKDDTLTFQPFTIEIPI